MSKDLDICERNAKITKTFLGLDDHGIMTFYISLDYGDREQAAGGFSLDEYDTEKKIRVGTGLGINLIVQILNVIGVEKWEDLKGRYVRARKTHTKVHEIGHIIQDEWVNFSEFFKDGGGS